MTEIDFRRGECGMGCADFVRDNFGRLGEYIGPGTFMAAVFNTAWNNGEYDHAVRKAHKGMWAAYRKAARMEYVCDQFVYGNHIPDIYEINNSRAVRCGGPMKDSYKKTIDELGGYPRVKKLLLPPSCALHARYLWGVFKDLAGYTQGDIQTDRRLLGYISFIRFGDLGIYSQILGHGDYLGDGIMPLLHFKIVEWCRAMGVRAILYDSWVNAESLQNWKRRLLFAPDRLTIKEAHAVS